MSCVFLSIFFNLDFSLTKWRRWLICHVYALDICWHLLKQACEMQICSWGLKNLMGMMT